MLRKAVEAHKAGGTYLDWLFLAMTYRRLGQEREALAWFHRSDALAVGKAQFPVSSVEWSALEPLLLRALRDEFEQTPKPLPSLAP